MAKKWKESKRKAGGGPPIYGLGFLGAMLYFLHASYGFWPSVLAILKAFVWPVFLVYHVLALH